MERLATQWMEKAMHARVSGQIIVMLFALVLSIAAAGGVQAASMQPPVPGDGVVLNKSAFPFGETITRLKKDIADKGLVFFSEIDQAKLASDAKIKLKPSTLLVFGNPALGTLFLTSNPYSGLDWPVRLLVTEDEAGQVWTSFTDFAYIARRHHIADREAEFKKASEVIGSITSSVMPK
jgi:uncharacterized protein (DUF302 family)